MANVFGLIGLLAFIAGVISLAAGITWLVVKVLPMAGTEDKKT